MRWRRLVHAVWGLSLAAAASPARPDALAALEDEQVALFEAVAPAVVVVRAGSAVAKGFAVATGLVLTAAHAVVGERRLDVTLHDGRVVRGELLESSRDGLDLALIRIPATPGRVLELAPSPEVQWLSSDRAAGAGAGLHACRSPRRPV